VWQDLYEELKDHGFVVIAVALDSREGDPLPWIEAANPTYPCLIDRDHRWPISIRWSTYRRRCGSTSAARSCVHRAGRGLRGFRRMDRVTREVPADAARMTAETKATYLNAIRDWVRLGQASSHALDAERARARAPQPTEEAARAHVFFQLGQHLIRHGQPEEGDRWLAEASHLHPDSWAIWRQRAGVNELGLAAQPDFWARVDALGERRYYAPIEMEGMP
jgi:hypothetical protein